MSTGNGFLCWVSTLAALAAMLGSADAQMAPKGEVSLSDLPKAKESPEDITKVFLAAYHGGRDVMSIYSELAKLPNLQKLTIYPSFPEKCAPAWALLPTYPALTEIAVMNAGNYLHPLIESIGRCKNLTSFHLDFE